MALLDGDDLGGPVLGFAFSNTSTVFDGEDFGGPILGFASSSVVDVALVRADIYAQDLLWLQFSTDMRRDAALLGVDSYAIAGTGTPRLREVMTGKVGDAVASEVWLVGSGFIVGEEYTITVPGPVRSARGSVLKPNQSAKFIARRTAIDGIISSLPKAYRTLPGSRIRGLINAVGRQIDLTKGSRRDYLP